MSGLSVSKLKERLAEDPVWFFRQHRGVKMRTKNGHEVTLQGIRVPKSESYAGSGMHFKVETGEESLTFVNPFNALAYIEFLDKQAEDAGFREGMNIFSTSLD